MVRQMRTELNGALLVQGILIARYCGESATATITQQEMTDAMDWKLRVGFTSAARPEDGVWHFVVEKPDLCEADVMAQMTPAQVDEYVRQRDAIDARHKREHPPESGA